MLNNKKSLAGIPDFKDLRTNGYLYVDKTESYRRSSFEINEFPDRLPHKNKDIKN